MNVTDGFLPRPAGLPGAQRLDRTSLSVSAPSLPQERASLSGVTSCPTGIGATAGQRALARQGRAGAEQAACQAGGGPGAAPASRELASFRQGLCPFLSQACEGDPQRLSALGALTQALQEARLDPVDFFQEVSRQYGDSLQVGPVLLESRPEVVQKVLAQTEPAHTLSSFSKSPMQTEALGSLYGHDTLFLSDGEDWRAQRQLMQPFFGPQEVKSPEAQARLQQVVERHVQGWAALPEVQRGEPVDLGARLRELTLDAALQHMFSVQLSDQELERAVGLFGRAGRQATDRLLGRPAQADPDLQAGLDGLADRLLAGRKPGEPRHDLLQALLDQGGDPAGLRHQVLTMALLGHETTASLLSWTLAEVSHHPLAYQRLQAEADTGVEGPEIRGAVHETFRLHPSNPLVLRQVTQEVSLAGQTLEPGTQILMPLAAVNRQAAGPEGEEWDPERPGVKMFSFGGGPRVCLGQVFARQEADEVVAEILRRYEVEPASARTPGPQTAFSSAPADAHYRLRPRG